jgi:hypothetical protein
LNFGSRPPLKTRSDGDDLRNNWNHLIDAAGLMADQRKEAMRLFGQRVLKLPGTEVGWPVFAVPSCGHSLREAKLKPEHLSSLGFYVFAPEAMTPVHRPLLDKALLLYAIHERSGIYPAEEQQVRQEFLKDWVHWYGVPSRMTLTRQHRRGVQ